MTSQIFNKTAPPAWLLDFWKEIDNKTWGKGFDCFAPNAIANLGVSDWHGREAIRENLRAFVDTGFTAHHDVVEYWDGGFLKVFRGFVTMTPNDPAQKPVRPAMTHFFYMDEEDPSKVAHWYGSVGPGAVLRPTNDGASGESALAVLPSSKQCWILLIRRDGALKPWNHIF